MIDIKWGTLDDCARAQEPLLHKDVISWLGGMTFLDSIKALAVTPKTGKTGFWYAEQDGKVLGTLLCGGRPAAFRAKYGSVGVLPEFRRRRVSTALYACQTIQQIFEGKRLWEDSIVGDNPYQFASLPTYGLRKVGELRHRTGSGKGLVLFDFSLLEPNSLETMLDRFTGRGFKLHILENWYSDEVWAANQGAYAKQMPAFGERITVLRDSLRFHRDVEVHRDTSPHPTEVRSQRARDLRAEG